MQYNCKKLPVSWHSRDCNFKNRTNHHLAHVSHFHSELLPMTTLINMLQLQAYRHVMIYKDKHRNLRSISFVVFLSTDWQMRSCSRSERILEHSKHNTTRLQIICNSYSTYCDKFIYDRKALSTTKEQALLCNKKDKDYRYKQKPSSFNLDFDYSFTISVSITALCFSYRW